MYFNQCYCRKDGCCQRFQGNHGKADISKWSAVTVLVEIVEKRTVNLNEKWTCQLRFRSGFEIRRRAVTLAIRKQRQAVQGDLPY